MTGTKPIVVNTANSTGKNQQGRSDLCTVPRALCGDDSYIGAGNSLQKASTMLAGSVWERK